jgi:hypothetical protein
VKVYVNDNTPANYKEEGEFFYHTKPKLFKYSLGTYPLAIWKHKTEGLWNAIDITFENEIAIPVNGFIEVEFKTANAGSVTTLSI